MTQSVEDLREELSVVNPGLGYAPPGFRYQSALIRARELYCSLEKSPGGEIVFNYGIQDATFFVDIGIRPYGSVRLSNFADLATVLGEEKFPAEVLDIMIAALERHGYRYVRFAVFGLPFEERERVNDDLFNQLFDYV